MAQTKRKRRNKHRGNAVGMVEARGRTSKPREGAKPQARGASTPRGQRALKPPTFQGSLIKAAVGGLVLFVLVSLGVLGNKGSTGSALALCVVAIAFYTPIMYLTDRWVYKRKTAQAQAQGRS